MKVTPRTTIGTCVEKKTQGYPEEQRTFIDNTIRPNNNVTVPIGPVTLFRMIAEALRLSKFLDSLKRRQEPV